MKPASAAVGSANVVTESAGIDSRTVRLRTTDGRGGHTEIDLRYLVAGEGSPVVLLHGIGLDSATVSWRHCLPALAENHRVYAPDFPGHDGSGRPRVRYTTAYFRSVLETFLDELELAGEPLVGISMGGAIALGYGLDHDVDRLALVDSYGLGYDAPWRMAASAMLQTPGAYRGWWAGLGFSRAALRAHLQTLTAGPPPEDLVEDVYDAVRDPAVGRTVSSWQRSEFCGGRLQTCYLDRLAELDAEALFVHGVNDSLLPASWSERAAERAGGRLELFDDCGHWPPREAPERFNRIVGEFL